MISRHLSPVRIRVLASAFFGICFGILAFQVVENQPITTFDAHIAKQAYDFAKSHPLVYQSALLVTDLGAGRPRTIVIVAVALLLLYDRKWRLAICWLLAEWLIKEVVAFAKNSCARPRPDYPEATTLAGGWAFPSGHSTGAMATYGLLAYILAMQWRDRRRRWPMFAVLGFIVLSVGASRMLLGVHWFTDVLGGYLLGIAYVALWAAVIEFVCRGNATIATPQAAK